MLDREDLWRFRYYVLERLEEGRPLDDLFAEALFHVWKTKNPEIQPESLRLRQKLVDTEKRIFKVLYSAEKRVTLRRRPGLAGTPVPPGGLAR